ncbi:type II secretion system protein GspM [Gammaproteobacteria bacterium AB-CW1]|uniref:Type II secretion system protein GspM n=1 Tax=Natronospira elongata TaxID=3110268 RepID=A0AAP6MLR6_9GAMM|nr:type II secretion system protein GspM [Gammaproteobacteria bacterium AB-CW1]
MMARIQLLRERIDALSLRERVLVFLAAAAVVAFIWHTFFMAPLSSRQETAQQQISDLRERVAEANAAVGEIIRAREADPDADRRARLAELEERIQALDENLAARTGDLIEPGQMALVLETMLERQEGLELLSMQSLSPRPLMDDEGLEGVGNIYRHGVRMELEGSFTAILRYLRALEAMDSDFYWGLLDVQMETYPNNRIVLIVHTLSLREGWIGV